ncbi:YHS domain-containing (seleno)protein [Paucibacter sp. AS339]|uniref:YHS domain-containing (seleno)protein n=1 Tax=Paucibacter hankyongi TaxID=3133434 RepID=UPI0030A44CD9
MPSQADPGFGEWSEAAVWLRRQEGASRSIVAGHLQLSGSAVFWCLHFSSSILCDVSSPFVAAHDQHFQRAVKPLDDPAQLVDHRHSFRDQWPGQVGGERLLRQQRKMEPSGPLDIDYLGAWMKLVANLLVAIAILFAGPVQAGSFVNTIGSPGGVAIQGYDAVAFHLDKRAVKGVAEFSVAWAGATWWFASAEAKAKFETDPERWAPQYGGHCALGMSEGYVSKKPTSGRFDIQEGKLYLFPAGTNSPDGPYNDWRRFGGPAVRMKKADENWTRFKPELEAQP